MNLPYVFTPKNTKVSLPIPKEYVGKRLQVSFKVLPAVEEKPTNITPFVASLKVGVSLPVDYDYKSDKTDFLLNKKD